MNEKEIGELRRRFRPEKSNITHVRGCYVNEKREIVSQFDQSLAMMTQTETEEILAILRRTLSGTLGKNLIDVSFDTSQVVDSDEHKLLMALRQSALQDENAVQEFFFRVTQSLVMEGNYMILLVHDAYDVPFRSADGFQQEDASSEVYSYMLCSICPVKMTKPALSYYAHENRFYNRDADWIISPPELGFLFPAFDDRCANLYASLYYTRNAGENHQEFVDTIFRQEIPMPAEAQKETFDDLLGQALAEECSLEVVQSVHEQLCDKIEAHKQNKEEEPLALTKRQVSEVLSDSGVSEERVAAFEEKFDASFGAEAALSPRNLVDARRFKVCTPDVTIQVNPERSDLVETRLIGGVRYILIRAEEGVEVNGVDIQIR
ncbi:DUF4317 domain-containing protein [Fournierella massiliensis]|nr:DUF4317 domain-containing protein [Fournierella massiliensis]MCF2558279.1 DUF4317 domain-containing protein [Fournierella massiliensis]